MAVAKTPRKPPAKPPLKPPPVGAGEDDFLAFWDQHQSAEKRPTKTILGVEVVVPYDLPLNFEREAERLKKSSDPDDLGYLVSLLFGQDLLDQWIERGLRSEQFKVLLSWASLNAAGRPTDFAEAAEIAAKAEAAAGKALVPNRATKRAAARASSTTRGSAGTGRTSKQTSAASTGSSRRTSRA